MDYEIRGALDRYYEGLPEEKKTKEVKENRFKNLKRQFAELDIPLNKNTLKAFSFGAGWVNGHYLGSKLFRVLFNKDAHEVTDDILYAMYLAENHDKKAR